MKRLITSLALAMLMVAVMVVPAMAANPDTTDVTGDIPAILDLTPPEDIDFGNFAIGPNTASSGTDGSIGCNDPDGYYVTVESDKADGKMVSPTPNTLTNELYMTTGLVINQIADTTVRTCVDEGGPGQVTISLSVSQDIVYADPADTGYTLTLTYTATTY